MRSTLIKTLTTCCFIILLLQVATVCLSAAAGIQSDCETAADDLRLEQGRLKNSPGIEELEDALQRLKHITDACPNLADGWYFRARVEQKLGKSSDYSLEKARRLSSPALKNNVDPFSAGVVNGNSDRPPSPHKESVPPKIVILSPAVTRGQSARLKTCSVTVKGQAIDDSGIQQVILQDIRVDVDRQGNFSANLNLKAGNNIITVTAFDIHGNKTSEEFGLACDSASPPVVASNPSPTNNSSAALPPSIVAAKQYALVIGINAYQRLPKLDTAVNDATEVARVLREEFGFETKQLFDAKATREQILYELRQYGSLFNNDGRLLIYFAGHGYNDKTVKKAYWQPVNATDDEANWISADDLTTSLRRIKARQILVVSDSCYSGEMGRSGGERPPVPLSSPLERYNYLEKNARERSRVLLASGGDEPVADGGGGNHSIFAAKFLLGLREMNQNAFTASELFNAYVSVAVSGSSDQLPRHGVLLSAEHVSGDFIFVRRR